MNDTIRPGMITSIMIDENAPTPIVTSGNMRLIKQFQQGIPVYQLFINPSTALTNAVSTKIALDVLEHDESMIAYTITINKRVLENPELLQRIQETFTTKNDIISIRISDENYTLTPEDYSKLSFAELIMVDNCVPELEYDPKVLQQKGVFKYENLQGIQRVLERRSRFDEITLANIFHITHPLSEEEFQYLAIFLEATDNARIELDYYDPSYYNEFLEQLQQHVSRTDIQIQLLGYLLEDNIERFECLEKYPYEIDVIYSTCHDMVDKYQEEPFTANRAYRSSIEGGGVTSLGNYLNVLEEIISFEAEVKHLDLSPLEIAVYAKMRIDSSSIYDPDFSDINTDDWDNTNLSQLIHHERDGRRRAVCLGFSTLYSAYLRKCNIPMFRYSTYGYSEGDAQESIEDGYWGHCRNMGRIKDDKYGVDSVCVADITWDLQNPETGDKSYNFFMVAPRDAMRFVSGGHHEGLTIPDTLALPREEYELALPIANGTYEQFFHPFNYDSRGYAARFLELAGLAPEDQDLDFYDVVYRLNEEHRLDGIPQETIDRAIDSVLKKRRLSLEEQNRYRFDVETSRQYAAYSYSDSPEILGIDMNDPTGFGDYPIEVLTPENARDYRRQLWESGVERLVYPSENHSRNRDNAPHIDTETEVTPIENHKDTEREQPARDDISLQNDDYIHQLIRYCQNNNISVYNYYRNVGRYNRHESSNAIPAFESTNPFLSADDYTRLQDSTEHLTVHYFASTMMRVINLNLTAEEQLQYENLFSRQEDIYVEALIEEDNERMRRRNNSSNNRERKNVSTETDRDVIIQDMLDESNSNTSNQETNENYLNAVIQYTRSQNISLYDYYVNVAEQYRTHNENSLPAFERTNPFISEQDIQLLTESEDQNMSLYFASALSQIIERNLPRDRVEELQSLFDDPTEKYNEHIVRGYM